ncbi:MAG: hypothetical protein HQK57_16690 [Deltaproteobacteria bacterium]|nr:hypothetical protein [Deltaproteobacteria bacterium]MBF0523949.1 hypothetical protein [Deltaproteobacteria bacterium]
MKKSIVLSVFLFACGLFLPVCHAATSWTGCVYDTSYPNTKYNYVVDQVGSGSTAYATVRGTVVNTTASQDAFPGTMDGYIESSTSKIHFTIVYRNNWGSRFYVIDRNGAGISWAVDATGVIYDSAHSIQVQTCPAGDESVNNQLNDVFNLDQHNR